MYTLAVLRIAGRSVSIATLLTHLKNLKYSDYFRPYPLEDQEVNLLRLNRLY